MLRTLSDQLECSHEPCRYAVDSALERIHQHAAAIELKQETRSIEIVLNGVLQRVYFRKPAVCNFLSPKSKTELLMSIGDAPQPERIREFYENSESLMTEMYQRQTLADNRIYLWAVHNEHRIKSSMLLTVFLMNLLLLWYWVPSSLVHDTTVEATDREGLATSRGMTWSISLLLRLLGLGVTFGSGLTLWIYLNSSGHTLLTTKWRTIHGLKHKSLSFDWFYVRQSLLFLVHDPWFCYNVAHFLSALFATLTMAPYCFGFLLLDIVPTQPELQSVIRSVTANGRSLLLTFVLAVILLYNYSIYGYLFFANMFENEHRQPCDSLFRCFVTVVIDGIRQGGGLGDLMVPSAWDDPMIVFRTLFDLSSWIVLVILLNMLFGIIVDTFADLRSRTHETLSSIQSRYVSG